MTDGAHPVLFCSVLGWRLGCQRPPSTSMSTCPLARMAIRTDRGQLAQLLACLITRGARDWENGETPWTPNVSNASTFVACAPTGPLHARPWWTPAHGTSRHRPALLPSLRVPALRLDPGAPRAHVMRVCVCARGHSNNSSQSPAGSMSICAYAHTHGNAMISCPMRRVSSLGSGRRLPHPWTCAERAQLAGLLCIAPGDMFSQRMPPAAATHRIASHRRDPSSRRRPSIRRQPERISTVLAAPSQRPSPCASASVRYVRYDYSGEVSYHS
ncbi:hypothetical protein C8Q78DRAFT_320196 [Trametes maxima]|nr:hypothetical protein C8Q78DRAFT_320196 [Trametes maxima]